MNNNLNNKENTKKTKSSSEIKRYNAMKKLAKYISNKILYESSKHIYKEVYNNTNYNVLMTDCSIVYTKDDIRDIQIFDTEGNINDICYSDKWIKYCLGFEKNAKIIKIDINKLIIEAKKNGFKSKNDEFFCKIDKNYFRINLIEQNYNVIKDDKEAELYYADKPLKPVIIKTDIGGCILMPIKFNSSPEGKFPIIDIENFKIN